MPIYEYECTKCGKIEEVLQNFSDKPLTKCQSCTGKLQKLISQSTFHLKGTGWYVTDYGGKKSSDSEKPKEESTSSTTKTDKAETSTTKEKKSD